MSQNTEDPTSTDPTIIQWIQPQKGICEVYANQVHMTWTKDDVRIRLGQWTAHQKGLNPGKQFKSAIEERGAVTLPWRMAKLLRDQLTQIIDSYETSNGTINKDVQLPKSKE
jgi:hypothetical protein